MTAEITTIRTAAETAAALATTPDLAALEARTLTAVTDVLRAAADLARAQRPIVLYGPEPVATLTVAPDTAAYGASVHIPAPPMPPPVAVSQVTHRPVLWGDKALWFGSGAILTGVMGAIVATASGPIWVLLLSVAGALLVLVGAAAINHAERP